MSPFWFRFHLCLYSAHCPSHSEAGRHHRHYGTSLIWLLSAPSTFVRPDLAFLILNSGYRDAYRRLVVRTQLNNVDKVRYAHLACATSSLMLSSLSKPSSVSAGNAGSSGGEHLVCDGAHAPWPVTLPPFPATRSPSRSSLGEPASYQAETQLQPGLWLGSGVFMGQAFSVVSFRCGMGKPSGRGTWGQSPTTLVSCQHPLFFSESFSASVKWTELIF